MAYDEPPQCYDRNPHAPKKKSVIPHAPKKKSVIPHAPKKKSVIDVSDNRLNAWNFCPKSWALQYIDGWKPLIKGAAFNKGSWFHLGVEHALKLLVAGGSIYATYSADELAKKFEGMVPAIASLIGAEWRDLADTSNSAGTLTEERAQELADQAGAAIWMTKHYLRHLAPRLEHKMILGIEVKFEDLFNSGYLPMKNRGVIDLLLYDPFEKTIIILDHKSASDLLDAEKRLIHSIQHVGYVRWVRELVRNGKTMDVLGSKGKVCVDLTNCKIRPMFRIVRSKVPREPKILKNGTISSAAISTIREVYLKALQSQSQPIGTDFSDKQLARADSLPEAWINSVEPVVTDADIALWEQEMGVAAGRMKEARVPFYQTRNTRNCHECRLVNVCKMGDDPDFEQVKEEHAATQ